MASHDISANISSVAAPSPVVAAVSSLTLVKRTGSVFVVPDAVTVDLSASSSPPPGPTRPSSGLVYPVYL